MTTLYYHIEAPGVNILNTVTNEVVTGLLDEIDAMRYFQDSVYIKSKFASISQYAGQDNIVTLVKDRCDVEVVHVMDKSQVPWPVEEPYTTTAYGMRSGQKLNRTPILLDDKAGVSIEHMTVASALEMNFVLTFKTFDVACLVFDTLQSKYKGSLVQSPFDIAFSYPVSSSLLQFITAVYKAKTDYQSKTVLDYINDMKRTQISFDIRKSQLTDPGADKQLMIRCQQLGGLALLTMDQKEPDDIKNDELAEAYTISFNLVFQYGRPNLIIVNTPIVIDNTVLPYNLFENLMINFHHAPNVGGVYQDLLCNEYMRRSFGNYTNASEIVRFPVYDDWYGIETQSQVFGYRPFLIANFTLDGPTTTFNISQIQDISLHPVLKAIFLEQGNNLFNYGGLFHVAVYAGSLRLGPELVSVDENLNLTVTSNRNDKVYRLVISETTTLRYTDTSWDQTLIKYRYFFPMTIERNIAYLVGKKYFYVNYDNSLLSLISGLFREGALKGILSTLVQLGEYTFEIFSYTQNPSQLADFMAYTQSQRTNYVLPQGTDSVSVMINTFYTQYTSVEGRSLLVAFLEQCLIAGFVTLDTLPEQYLEPSRTAYPYYYTNGGYYGINTPLRVINYTVVSQQRS